MVMRIGIVSIIVSSMTPFSVSGMDLASLFVNGSGIAFDIDSVIVSFIVIANGSVWLWVGIVIVFVRCINIDIGIDIDVVRVLLLLLFVLVLLFLLLLSLLLVLLVLFVLLFV